MEYKQLIKKAKRGDITAFTELYKSIYKKLYQYAYYTLGNPEDAEDAVSDTVMDAFHGIKKLKSDEAFQSWIFQILHAKCNRKLREIYKQRKIIDFESYLEATGKDAESDSVDEITDSILSESLQIIDRIDLKNALELLDPLDRQIINLHILLGYHSNEISELLGINPNTIRSREARALKKLRASVKEVI